MSRKGSSKVNFGNSSLVLVVLVCVLSVLAMVVIMVVSVRRLMMVLSLRVTAQGVQCSAVMKWSWGVGLGDDCAPAGGSGGVTGVSSVGSVVILLVWSCVGWF